MTQTYRLILDCPDSIGIVSKVGGLITENGGWISEASQHSDIDSKRFFSRLEVNADSLLFGVDVLREKFQPLVEKLQLNLRIVDSAKPKRVILMVSKGNEHI